MEIDKKSFYNQNIPTLLGIHKRLKEWEKSFPEFRIPIKVPLNIGPIDRNIPFLC